MKRNSSKSIIYKLRIQWLFLVLCTSLFSEDELPVIGDSSSSVISKPASSAESLALQAKYIPYGPMRSSSIDIIKKGEPYFNTGVDVLPHMPNTPKRLRRSVIADPFWWADNGAEVSERFGVWKGN